jgi:peptidoglycan/xylan/chitin deacetylase (PgdA/CDA1 family)
MIFQGGSLGFSRYFFIQQTFLKAKFLFVLGLVWGTGSAVWGNPTPTATPAAVEIPFTVLCYHRFINHPTEKTTLYKVKVEEFRWQMQYLKDNGITPISMQQLLDYWYQGKSLPPKPVLLTFDDGFRSVYEDAFPILKEFGYPGVLFLISSFVQIGDMPFYTAKNESHRMAMNDAEIKEMQKSGLTVESHTVSHLNMGLEAEKRTPADFKQLVHREIFYPIGFLKQKFGQAPVVLAYPYGVYNDVELAEVKQLYQMAFTVNAGPNDRSVDPYKLRRYLVLASTTRPQFMKMFGDRVLHIANAGPGDGESLWSRKPLITIRILDEVDPQSIVLNLESRKLKTTYDPKLRLVRYRVEEPLRMGGHQLTLRAKDVQGNTRVFSWYFRIRHRGLEKTQAGPTPVPAAPAPQVTHETK